MVAWAAIGGLLLAALLIWPTVANLYNDQIYPEIGNVTTESGTYVYNDSVSRFELKYFALIILMAVLAGVVYVIAKKYQGGGRDGQ